MTTNSREQYQRWLDSPALSDEEWKELSQISGDEDEMLANLLEAYGIPCLRQFPKDGSFGRVVLGMSGNGADIYVPETMLEDAKNLISEDGEYDDEQ